MNKKLPTRQVHIDFHTPTLPFTLAKDFNKTTFQETLVKAHVNSVTLTGRCHHGYIYYDTKLPARHPQMIGDFLMEQIDACHEVDINAPVYITAGWDAYSADHHPEWLERKPNGEIYGFENCGQLQPGWKTLCFNTGYMDYLKMQVKDLIYHVDTKLDGLFFDIVWQDPCCCNACVKKMLEEGLDPKKEADRIQFAEETEIRFKNDMYAYIKSLKGDCPIFFNEGNITPSNRPNMHQYSHYEIESLPSGEWGYQHFPTVVRYVKNLNKEYVGMTGKFHKVWADFGSYKNQAALEYECFLAQAHGAKCSIGDQMYPNGVLQPITYQKIGEVYRVIESREPWFKDIESVSEIAILHPGIIERTQEKVDTSLAGAVNMLNESHYQFVVIDDEMDFQKYKLIILPDKIICHSKLSQKIENYINQGGKILGTYMSCFDDNHQGFIPALEIAYLGENEFNPTYAIFEQKFFNKIGVEELVMHGPSLKIESLHQGEVMWEMKPLYNRTYQHYYSHFQAPADCLTGISLGVIHNHNAYFAHPLFQMYKRQGVKYYKDIIISAIDLLLSHQKFIECTLPSTADVILNHQKNRKRFVLSILHYIPERRALGIDTIEETIPLYHTSFKLLWKDILKHQSIDNEKSIKCIRNVSTLEEYSFIEEGDVVIFKIPYIEGYETIEIEY